MAKIPSRKFPSSKKKIASQKFPQGKRKIASKKLGEKTTKNIAQETAENPETSTTKPDNSVPINLKSRSERLAALMKQSKSLKPASELPKKRTKCPSL